MLDETTIICWNAETINVVMSTVKIFAVNDPTLNSPAQTPGGRVLLSSKTT